MVDSAWPCFVHSHIHWSYLCFARKILETWLLLRSFRCVCPLRRMVSGICIMSGGGDVAYDIVGDGRAQFDDRSQAPASSWTSLPRREEHMTRSSVVTVISHPTFIFSHVSFSDRSPASSATQPTCRPPFAGAAWLGAPQCGSRSRLTTSNR